MNLFSQTSKFYTYYLYLINENIKVIGLIDCVCYSWLNPCFDCSVIMLSLPKNIWISGNSERDDDSPDMYGGVVYIYNEHTVKVMAPYGYNNKHTGAAIYTGKICLFSGWCMNLYEESNKLFYML